MELATAKQNATTNLPDLGPRTEALRQRINALKHAELDQVDEMFSLLILADFHAVELEQQCGITFGFDEHDARYLRSLRNQMMGSGCAQRDLTKAQRLSLKVVLLTDHYTKQVALLSS